MTDKTTRKPKPKPEITTQTSAQPTTSGATVAPAAHTLKLEPVGTGGMVCENGVCRWEGPDPASVDTFKP